MRIQKFSIRCIRFLGYTPPGTAEVAQNVAAIEDDRSRLLVHYWHAALHKPASDPLPLVTYLHALDSVGSSATDGVRGVFRDAGRLNSDIADATHEAIVQLADIRLGSSL